MRPGSRLSSILLGCVVAAGLACGGGDEPEGPCCTVDDVIELHGDGVEEQVLLDAVRASPVVYDLRPSDLKRLVREGVPPRVIDALNGGPCQCGDAQRSPGPRTDPADGVGLDLSVKYSGGRNFELVNRSRDPYTNLRLVVNDRFEHRIDRLAPHAGQFVRLAAFVGEDGAPQGELFLERLLIQADQGSYLRAF